MNRFRKTPPARSVMFTVSYDDGRTAYLTIENHGLPSEDHLVASIACERQKLGDLPHGKITRIRRVR